MDQPLQLLLVEDNEDDAFLVVHTLRKDGLDVNWRRVQTAGEMRSALAQNYIGAIICDYALPRFSAPAALKVMQESGRDLPFIVVSGTIGEDLAVGMMRAGAHDYLMKSSLSRLTEAVRREVREAEGRAARRRAELEREAALDALRNSEQFLQSALDSLTAHIAILDAREVILAVNTAWRRFGQSNGLQTEDAAVGVNYLNICDQAVGENAEEAATVAAGIRDIIADRSAIFELEYPCHAPGGPRRWFTVRATAFRGGAARVVVAHQEITRRMVMAEQKDQALTALRTSEERFRRLAENSPAIIYRYRLTPALAIEYVSPAVEAILGYTPAECYTDSDLTRRLIHPEDQHQVFTSVEEMSQRTHQGMMRWCAKDGRTVWVEYYGVAVPGADGTGLAVEGIALDVTKRHQMTEEWRKLYQAVEQSPSMVVITDTVGRIEYVNPKFCEVTGYTFEEVLEQNPRLLKSGEMSPAEYSQLWQTITAGGEWHGEFHNRKKNGELYWEAASISPVRSENGQITHYVAVKEDITRRKRAEESAVQAQKLESIGLLAGGIAHDFKNLLMAVQMQVSITERKLEANHPARANLGKAQQSLQRATELTQQLLVYAGKGQAQVAPLDLSQIVRSNAPLFETVGGRRASVRFELAPELPLVEADPVQIQQVVMNLVINACEAYGDLPGEVTVRTRRTQLTDTAPDSSFVASARPHPGDYVCLEVGDHGVGMDAATRARIFDPFFTTKSDGRGLGLSAILGIVRSHHGELQVLSQLGQGTTFRVYLPVK
jgi:PAS domain S-box-containing protein